MPERLRLPVAAAVLALALAGCGDGPSVTVEQATTDYTALVDDVAQALVDDLGVTSMPPAAGSLAPGPEEGTCWFRSQTYTIPERLGIDVPIDDVRATVADVVEPEGWEVIDGEIPGGYEGLDAEGPDDATLELRAKSVTELRIVALVDGDCEREALPVE
ncbi:hypothetical protein [Nocardioides sp. LHG3406-4]|uniref:hypothetical protein n=1 Tax=Nocardioides sp. LHG3406-4 TaxID=2804575 RepID=UPI003CFAEC95